MAPRQSYGAIAIKHDEQEIQQLISGPTSSATTATTASTGKKKYFVFAALGVIAFVLVAVGYSKNLGKDNTAASQNHASSSSGNLYRKDSINAVSPEDLGFKSIKRENDASPSDIWGGRNEPLPTNSWYLNLVSHRASYQPDDSTRAYTVPYIIDTAPPQGMSGIRVHWPIISASDNNIQMVNDFKNSLSLGSRDVSAKYRVDPDATLSHLGVSLQWTGSEDSNRSMKTSIVRGMPYATMKYYGGAMPMLYSYNGPALSNTSVLTDGMQGMECGTLDSQTGKIEGNPVTVERELQLHFVNSDFTWGVYFSKPVKVVCGVTAGDEWTREFQLAVVEYEVSDEPFVTQVTLLDECTTGKSNIKGHCSEEILSAKTSEQYAKLMSENALMFPTTPKLSFSYPEEGKTDRVANVTIDWAPEISGSGNGHLIMFALPHHQESLNASANVTITDQCFDTFHGKSCLVKGSQWTLAEDLGIPVSFNAPRPPEAETMSALSAALAEDIKYPLSDNLLRAAADTYFSGKILARIGRVISIASEMHLLASRDSALRYEEADEKVISRSGEAAASENFPSKDEIALAVEQLKRGVQVWIGKDAEAPYVFDKSWGGFVNCGCEYVGYGDRGHCNNTFPDCPALADVNQDFGNGWYNDHHYHYGYHVYAAAVVAKHDPAWGAEFFDRVMLYIRDFANPSASDEFFPQFRQKDWFLGSSWASGIVSAENSPHGRNEESSSEAIAAYEAVALYGAVMAEVFSSGSDDGKLEAAKLVRDAGQLLTATELRATNRYWHVWSSDAHKNTYPEAYKQPVVGMLYDTMATFQTWFAPQAVVSYGIQLMPFTSVAEKRDDPEWAAVLYPLYEDACKTAGDFCVENGWSILQAGLCAETGDREGAMEQVLSIAPRVFNSEGGNGNSLSNMIWFIATRKPLDAGTHSS